MNVQELIEELECLEVATDSLDFLKGANFATERAINLAKQLNEPEKPTVKQFVADWFEDNFEELDWELGGVLINAFNTNRNERSDFQDWLVDTTNYPIEILIRMKLFGYEVEKEPLYAVKGLTDYFRYDNKVILFNDKQEALEIANKIGECCGIEEFNYINDLNFILISDLRNDEQTDEKEPLYYVKLPEIGYMRFGFCIPITENIEEAKKYTEQEIKAIDERYWPFAVKVEGE
ncbi:DUF1642 domain-containing protein [Enterococcus faecalis]|uniref:DUF1642 domain-containing protein n=1 Tax=Enterococcus faecalis TaxID=1351 RepID=UPI0003301734|nr:DUF1642 domain-containing protein [Enterococcus faecalis]EHG5940368.1 DUF1642 domain-containing protein [Enterococcus faecalis]EJZ8623832.1 DUF1642 domain-containing protein [Enterococcus faecalis]EKL7633407.1 DUF1642 domain-containing protein [Enterococcus faecalis]EKQ3610265.1 DUF1642 domain-containing protein [Enterococcus faecalis]EKZ0373439.1 DUF1642 domain-containing protein [Enterococcus faecalis]